jgi:hypothetical protein
MASGMMNTDVLVFHGATDAPTVDVVEVGVGAGTIVDDLSYGEYDEAYLELGTANYSLEIRDETGSVGVAAFSAPLAELGLEGIPVAVFASGFLAPENNSNGEAFGLLAVLPDGTALMLPNTTGIDETSVVESSFRIYPSPATEIVNINYELEADTRVSVIVMDITGKVVYRAEKGNQTANLYRETVNVSELPSGYYMVSLLADDTFITKKVYVK